MRSIKNRLTGFLLIFMSMIFASTVYAGPLSSVLEQSEPPYGVVFEFVESSTQSWEQAREDLLTAIEQIHQRFPGLPIAVVSHGNEQFALTRSNQTQFSALHNTVKDLGNQGIDVHVCGTYASWRDISPEDFPDYVDVAPSGPAQINNYKALGYQLVTELNR